MDFDKFSQKTAREINKTLEKLLSDWRSEVAATSKELLPLIDKFIEGSKGGKRIRGSLVVLGYKMTKHLRGVTSSHLGGEIIKIAAAYEIFHSAILAHDDVIDQSPLRRGQPSLYQALGGDRYGISQAICLGDVGFFLAVKIISESSFPEKEKSEALKHFSKIILSTILGEMLDVAKGDVSTIMKLKTAQYTVSGPLQLGAILAGADQKLIRVLGEFGENLGVAFQIQDDILGVFGSEETLGKSVTSDIEEGKNTLLVNFALQKSDEAQGKILGRYYGQGGVGDQGVTAVRQVFQDTKALDYAKKQAQKYKNMALKVLSGKLKDKIWSKLLEQMAEYLVGRSK